MKFTAFVPAGLVAVSMFSATTAAPVAFPRSEAFGAELEARDPFWGKVAGAVVKALAPHAINWVASKFKRDLTDEQALEVLANVLNTRSDDMIQARSVGGEAASFEQEFANALFGRSLPELEEREPIFLPQLWKPKIVPAIVKKLKGLFNRDLDAAVQPDVASFEQEFTKALFGRSLSELEERDPLLWRPNFSPIIAKLKSLFGRDGLELEEREPILLRPGIPQALPKILPIFTKWRNLLARDASDEEFAQLLATELLGQ